MLQILNQLLLLLEDVLEFSKSGLHLLQGELVLTLSRLVLGHPGVELSDGVVQEDPLLHQDLKLLHPGVRDSLHLVIPLLESSNFLICLIMGGHLLSSSLCSFQNLQEIATVLVKGLDLLIKSLDLVQIRWLVETFSSRLLSSSQPWVEFLDSSSVPSPVLDIVGVFVSLNLGISLQFLDIVCDSLQLILECLSISRDLVSLGKKILLSLRVSLEDLKLGSNVFLQVHGSGNSVLRKHSTRSFLDVLELSSSSILPLIQSLQRVVKSSESSNKINNDLDSGLEASNNLELLLNSLDLLGKS